MLFKMNEIKNFDINELKDIDFLISIFGGKIERTATVNDLVKYICLVIFMYSKNHE